MKALFVCIENAGRSQMAEAFAHAYGIEASSAGTIPAAEVNPVVIAAMKERDINITGAKPKLLTQKMVEDADVVVTMGCRVEDVCPRPLIVSMEKKLIDWHIEKVRVIRGEIESNLLELLNKRR